MAESECELQAALNAAHHNYTLWKLAIITQKTKVMIFSRVKSRNIPNFNYNGLPLDVVTDYRYLGIDFNYNGTFNKCKKHLFEQAERAMYSLLRKVIACVFL